MTGDISVSVVKWQAKTFAAMLCRQCEIFQKQDEVEGTSKRNATEAQCSNDSKAKEKSPTAEKPPRKKQKESILDFFQPKSKVGREAAGAPVQTRAVEVSSTTGRFICPFSWKS